MMFPYLEDSLSEYTELAGVAKNFLASLVKPGNHRSGWILYLRIRSESGRILHLRILSGFGSGGSKNSGSGAPLVRPYKAILY